MKIEKVFCVLIFAACCFLSAFSLSAQTVTFASESLFSAAKILGLEHIDTLMQGCTIIEQKEISLVVERKGNRIEHIGRKIFAPNIRIASPSPVYNYLEFAYLDQTFKISENPFLYQNLEFVSGDWNTFNFVNDSIPFTITSENGKRYRVEWQLPDTRELCLTFPIGYERLSLSSRRELELRFIEDLISIDTASIERKQLDIDESQLEKVAEDEWRLPGAHYMIKEINQDIYVRLNADNHVEAIFDKEHPAESLINLFTLGMIVRPKHEIVMTFKLYENKQKQQVATIEQLLQYAIQNGCKVYWGIEGITEEFVNATLMLVNEGYGYNHIFAITCSRVALFEESCVMSSDVSLFVPTSNISNIFYQPEAKSKKIKWQ